MITKEFPPEAEIPKTQEPTRVQTEPTAEQKELSRSLSINVFEKIVGNTASGGCSSINAVDTKMKWICVPVAMDSGSMVNVSPKGIFAMMIKESEASRRKDQFFGANNSPIPCLGMQEVNGLSEEETPISIDFDVADVSRPLGSISKLLRKKHKCVFDDPVSYIQNKITGKETLLRECNGLLFLDLWVKVPENMEIPERFTN